MVRMMSNEPRRGDETTTMFGGCGCFFAAIGAFGIAGTCIAPGNWCTGGFLGPAGSIFTHGIFMFAELALVAVAWWHPVPVSPTASPPVVAPVAPPVVAPAPANRKRRAPTSDGLCTCDVDPLRCKKTLAAAAL